jgi:hypothetical protein
MTMKNQKSTAPPRKQKDNLQQDDAGGRHAPQKRKEDVDAELDKSLEDSFPSSDPPAVSQPTKTEPAGDPKTKP